MSPLRKLLLSVSFVTALALTTFVVLLFGGGLASAMENLDDRAVDYLTFHLPALLGAGGMATACGSLDKRAGNSLLSWLSIAWNGVLNAGYLFFCVTLLLTPA